MSTSDTDRQNNQPAKPDTLGYLHRSPHLASSSAQRYCTSRSRDRRGRPSSALATFGSLLPGIFSGPGKPVNRQIAHHTIGCLFECQMTVRAQGASHLMVNVTCEDCGLGSSKQGTNSGAFETSTRGRSSWQTTTKISLETRISSSHEVTRSLGQDRTVVCNRHQHYRAD